MNNIADICRECELSQKVQQLEQAGTRLANRIIDVLDNIIDESALQDALENWEKVRRNQDERQVGI